MSNFQAIGGVSDTLRTLLMDRMELPEDLAAVPVTIGPPRPDTQNQQPDAMEAARVNLFLYRLTENAVLKNQEIPGHGSPRAFGFPPLSLNLYYLLTAYGTRDEEGRPSETLSHFLLGSAMRVFHDYPIILDELVTVRRQPIGSLILHESLRGEFERMKLSLEPISLEDLSKVWTALTLPFRVAAAYCISLVQIESQRPRSFPRRVTPPPAGGPHISVVPFKSPAISALAVHWQGDAPGVERPYPYARIGDTLIIRGTDLASPALRVRIGRVELTLNSTDPTRVEVVVPDATLPDGSNIPADRQLQPGVQTVDVTAILPELPSTGFPSNQAVFMVVPLPLTATPNLGVTPRTLQVTGLRLFHERYAAETVIGNAVVSVEAYTTATSTVIRMPIPDSVVAYVVSALVSAPLAGFPLLQSGDEIQMTIGGDGPRTVRFPRPVESVGDAAAILQAAMRAAEQGGPGFRRAQVTATAAGRLVIVPGGLHDAIAVAASPEAAAIGLNAAATEQVYLSGALVPFPALTSAAPQVQLAIGGVTHSVALGGRPTSIAEAASLLEGGIVAFPEAEFANSRVAALGNQLVVLPGGPGAVVFDAVAGVDESSVVELQLSANVPVRVRVNGAEGLNEILVDMTV